MHFGQVLTAMVTPFDQNDQVDLNQINLLIKHLRTHGTDGLVICGTTGESPVLTDQEKQAIIKTTVASVAHQVPVIVGTGGNNTRKAITDTLMAEEAGADGIMLVAPYYNRPNQTGIYAHFTKIARETSLPIMLYNIPSRCGVHIEAGTIIELSAIDNIVALKDASGDLSHVAKIIAHTPEHFSVYSGDDDLTLPMLSVGAKGVVSVASHVIGDAVKRMIQSYFAGNVIEAASIHRHWLPVMQAFFAAPSPAPVKAALMMQGLGIGTVRLPLVPLSEVEKSELEQILQANLVLEKGIT